MLLVLLYFNAAKQKKDTHRNYWLGSQRLKSDSEVAAWLSINGKQTAVIRVELRRIVKHYSQVLSVLVMVQLKCWPALLVLAVDIQSFAKTLRF
jgi:hypothetical protein